MQLATPVRESIISHAREAAPDEACGLLGGRGRNPPAVLDSIRTPNVAGDPKRRFEIDPEAFLSGHETIEEEGLDLLGFYHSHPEGPPSPSQTDLVAASWPETYTLLVSLADGDETLSAWFFTGETFQSVPIELRQDPRGGDST